MKKDNLSLALAALDDDFQTIDGYDVVPDGIYWGVVEEVFLEITQPSGNPRITWNLRLLHSDYFGCQIRRTFVITKDSLRWLKRDLYVCGVGLKSLHDLPGRLENLSNLKLKVRKQAKSVYILDADLPVSSQGDLFLHLTDETGQEYLDQQLLSQQNPGDQGEFEAIIDHFVDRYQCPRPHSAYVEDAKTGETLFRMEPSRK